MHFFNVVVLLLIPALSIHRGLAEDENSGSQFIFIPGKLLTTPLMASYHEPHVGLKKEIGTSRLKIDIGASVDMLEWRTSIDGTERFRLGIDFFTYALSTNSEGLRLQIDAVDGFFGGHVAYTNDIDSSSRFTLRLRLLHLSAHFLDGHFNSATQTWKDNRAPIPFTRDFGELVGMYDFGSTDLRWRVYAGFSYATLIRPTNIRRFEGHAGFELHTSGLVSSVFGKPFNLYLAHHFTLRGIPASVGTNNTEAGIKFGEWASTGMRIYLSYYTGLDGFSQYYDVRREEFGIGFAFDFW